MRWPSNSVKTLSTKRPFTPKETERKLVALGTVSMGPGQRKLSWTRVSSAGSHDQENNGIIVTKKTTLPQILSPKRDLRKQFRCFQEPSIDEIPSNGAEPTTTTTTKHNQREVNSAGKSHPPHRAPSALTSMPPPPPPVAVPAAPKALLPDKLTTILDNLKDDKDNVQQLENHLKDLRKEIKATKKVNSGEKKAIMDILSGVMERSDESANLAKIISLDIILLLKVSKANFGLASKIFFHLASNDKNDAEIYSQGVLDTYLATLGNFCPVRDQDVMLYGYGALKFLSYNPSLLKHMCGTGLIDLIVLHIKYLFQDKESMPQRNTILFQMTACLRNCLNISKGTESFVNLNGTELLANLTNSGILSSPEVMCNVSRMLSVLSLDDCFQQLLEPDLIDGALKILEKHETRCDILVRVAFYLGNIAGKDDDSRVYISKHPFMEERIPTILLNVVDNLEAGRIVKDVEKAEDAIIKICRIFANVSINANAGESVAMNEILVRALIKAIAVTDIEVVMPILSTLNNLSYYPIVHYVDVYTSIYPYISHEKEAIASEALRVLGNLTRKKEIRDKLREEDFLEYALDKMLSRSEDFRFSAAGVIVNMMTDGECRASFKELDGTFVCLQMLRDIKKTKNWPLGSLICQIMWNYSIHAEKIGENIEMGDKSELERYLITLLDSEQNNTEPPDEDSTYEEFSTVGFHLLSKLSPQEVK